jgi:cellulose synthase/poly-beta-1,6-N-acetylglucosamine synthase-like glycosyltransferase
MIVKQAMVARMPAISGVIPTWNRAALLGETLGSLAAQVLRLEHFEVVVVDDGSDDDTRACVCATLSHDIPPTCRGSKITPILDAAVEP